MRPLASWIEGCARGGSKWPAWGEVVAEAKCSSGWCKVWPSSDEAGCETSSGTSTGWRLSVGSELGEALKGLGDSWGGLFRELDLWTSVDWRDE